MADEKPEEQKKVEIKSKAAAALATAVSAEVLELVGRIGGKNYCRHSPEKFTPNSFGNRRRWKI